MEELIFNLDFIHKESGRFDSYTQQSVHFIFEYSVLSLWRETFKSIAKLYSFHVRDSKDGRICSLYGFPSGDFKCFQGLSH